MTSPKIDLSTLEIKSDFINRAQKLGLNTIDDIMNVNLSLLRKNKDFSYLWYSELLQILEDRGLLDEFEKRQL
ncbi:conserved hypothetical protein [Sphingobacterium sp. PM2-P1-29]|nr:conserved hypothetical protein [Sphingobacterium sp. PM2-P1-29]